jgi:GcrA cell cycle regulator
METVWTPELIEQLSAFWKQGLSTAEIGRRIGVSKNAVVGKAHRLLLDPRPSPLKRPPVRRVVGISGPACSWPTGHPGERDFHFCGKRPVAGKPYCAEHAELAYVKPKVEKSNAA